MTRKPRICEVSSGSICASGYSKCSTSSIRICLYSPALFFAAFPIDTRKSLSVRIVLISARMLYAILCEQLEASVEQNDFTVYPAIAHTPRI